MGQVPVQPPASSGSRSWVPIVALLSIYPGGAAFLLALGLDAETLVLLFLVSVPMALAFIGFELWVRRQGFRANRRPPSLDVVHTFVPGSSVTFTGGGRVGWQRATAPLVRLTADGDYAQLGGWVRTVWIPRSRTVAVHRSRGSGIMFRTPNGDFDGVAFYTFSANDVLASLARLGWPVVFH
jgi:hypothetical protein